MSTTAILAAVLISTSVFASDRFDHRGSIGLHLGPELEVGEWVKGGRFEEYARGGAQLGITCAIGVNGNELHGWAGVLRDGGSTALVGVAGYRGYFGAERVKSFVDLDARIDFSPRLTAGPRVGLGAQYEISPIVGLYAGIAVHAGVGDGLRFSAEAFSGFQFRTYLLE